MSMRVLEDAPQGGSVWHAARATRFCASEASAAMGVSKYMTRSALLQQKKTGISEDVSEAKQRLFDAGHASEAAALPIAEEIASRDFYPSVGIAEIDGLPLLASFDGIDMLGDYIWENKLLSASLLDQVRAQNLEPHYWAQLEHQLLVSGAHKVLFTTSDGTDEGTDYLWYESIPERREQLIAAWHQFAADLAAYVPQEIVADLVGRTPETLPALHIVLKGEVSASNLAEFKDVALTAIRRVNRTLKTDQDFADSAKARKWCEDIESRVAAAKDHALSQTASIDLLFRTMDEISAEARDVRLELEKLEKARKEARRGEIVAGGVKALGDHVAALNARLGKAYMPAVQVDFGGAVKGLRTFDSMQNAIDTALANAKIAASGIADRIQENMRTLDAHAEHAALFPDRGQILIKAKDDFDALVASRIAQHKASIEAAAEKARERIRQEEMQRIEREREEADAKARRAAEQQARDQFTLDSRAQQVIDRQKVAAAPVAKPVETAKAVDTPPTLSLGQIGTRLGFNLSAEFIRTLGFEPVKVKAACMFHEEQFDPICEALVSHVQSIQALQAA